jgi:hypothetical protein
LPRPVAITDPGAIMSDAGSSNTEIQEAEFIAQMQAEMPADVPPEALRPPPGPGQAAPFGGVSGAIAAGTLGTLFFGPIGTIVGAIIGANAGSAADDAGKREERERTLRQVRDDLGASYGADVEARHRAHYERSPDRLDDRPFESVQPLYELGHAIGLRPDFGGRSFDAIEPELQHAWSEGGGDRYGSWDRLRAFVRHGYQDSQDVATRRTGQAADRPEAQGPTGI